MDSAMRKYYLSNEHNFRKTLNFFGTKDFCEGSIDNEEAQTWGVGQLRPFFTYVIGFIDPLVMQVVKSKKSRYGFPGL